MAKGAEEKAEADLENQLGAGLGYTPTRSAPAVEDWLGERRSAHKLAALFALGPKGKFATDDRDDRMAKGSLGSVVIRPDPLLRDKSPEAIFL